MEGRKKNTARRNGDGKRSGHTHRRTCRGCTRCLALESLSRNGHSVQQQSRAAHANGAPCCEAWREVLDTQILRQRNEVKHMRLDAAQEARGTLARLAKTHSMSVKRARKKLWRIILQDEVHQPWQDDSKWRMDSAAAMAERFHPPPDLSATDDALCEDDRALLDRLWRTLKHSDNCTLSRKRRERGTFPMPSRLDPNYEPPFSLDDEMFSRKAFRSLRPRRLEPMDYIAPASEEESKFVSTRKWWYCSVPTVRGFPAMNMWSEWVRARLCPESTVVSINAHGFRTWNTPESAWHSFCAARSIPPRCDAVYLTHDELIQLWTHHFLVEQYPFNIWQRLAGLPTSRELARTKVRRFARSVGCASSKWRPHSRPDANVARCRMRSQGLRQRIEDEQDAAHWAEDGPSYQECIDADTEYWDSPYVPAARHHELAEEEAEAAAEEEEGQGQEETRQEDEEEEEEKEHKRVRDTGDERPIAVLPSPSPSPPPPSPLVIGTRQSTGSSWLLCDASGDPVEEVVDGFALIDESASAA